MDGQWSKNCQYMGLRERKLIILHLKKTGKLGKKDRQSYILEVDVGA